MQRRLFALLIIACALAAPAGQAAASSPLTVVGTTPAPNATGVLRYEPVITFTYDQPVPGISTSPPTLVRVSNSVSIPVTATVVGDEVQLVVQGTLVSNQLYRATVWPDGDATPDSITFRTLPPPAHPTLHAKIITAIPPEAVADIAQRLDRANQMAPPRVQDFVDISAASGRALSYLTDLSKGYQAALVVTDGDVLDQTAVASALVRFVQAGHGVVVAGQTHWLAGGPSWTAASAIGGATSTWASTWSPYSYRDPQPGDVTADSTVKTLSPHFLTRYFVTGFEVICPGSGELSTHFTPPAGYALAFLQDGQVFIATRQTGPSRVVDLGFRPWSKTIPGGGFNPATSQGGALTARALLWATNRLAPHGTHFVVKPRNPSPWTSVVFTMAASDPDLETFMPLRYHYRVNNGLWRVAPGTTFVLYFLHPGSWYTVRVFATDSGGNRDPRPAVYRFRISPSATN
ncbi:MAG: Ig-like domain-containing protein [Gaiellales bacterium]